MEQTFVSKIFLLIARLLQNIVNVTNLTYNEINIIVYYFVIPLSWCIMLDCITKLPVITLLFITIWIIIFLKVKSFSQWCNKGFELSQKFICFFGEYVKSSVIICVLIPLLIYIILIYLLI